jgi:hypothetical protein
MKKLAILLALLFVVASIGDAAAMGLGSKGIKGGLNLASHSGDDTDEYHKTRTAFAAGAFLELNTPGPVAIRPEVLFSQKGYKWDDGDWAETGKFSYLDIPVLIKYKIQTPGTVTPNLFVGPVVSFLLSAKVDSEYEGESETTDVKDDAKSTDFGAAIGGGVDINLGANTVTFDVRYVLGLSKIDDTETAYDVKNSVISFLVGFGF